MIPTWARSWRPWRRGPIRPGRAGVTAAVAVLVAALAVVRMVDQERAPARPAPPAAAPAPAPPAQPGLRLLVGDLPTPFVLDVERATTRPVAGLPAAGDRGVSVLPVGGSALVLSNRHCDGCPADTTAYLVAPGGRRATRLATGAEVIPSRDGRGVWTHSRRGAGRCAVRELGLDGRPRRPARPLSCRTSLIAELPAGLLTSSVGPLGHDPHHRLLDPDGGGVRVGFDQAQPVVGNLVLTGSDRGVPLVLHDLRNGTGHRLRWPGRSGYGLAEVAGEPGGRRAVVELARYSPEHRLDLWLLDTASRRWRHLPGMPVPLAPKITDVRWTADGRVVVLSGDRLAVWRPGAPRLTVRRVPPPRRPGGGFVVW